MWILCIQNHFNFALRLNHKHFCTSVVCQSKPSEAWYMSTLRMFEHVVASDENRSSVRGNISGSHQIRLDNTLTSYKHQDTWYVSEYGIVWEERSQRRCVKCSMWDGYENGAFCWKCSNSTVFNLDLGLLMIYQWYGIKIYVEPCTFTSSQHTQCIVAWARVRDVSPCAYEKHCLSLGLCELQWWWWWR